MKNVSSNYRKFLSKEKKFAPLIDPDKYTAATIKKVAILSEKARVDFLFYGGSLVTKNQDHLFIRILKDHCSAPVILFPGSNYQILEEADGILLLSLISGRNPEMLIGNHVIAAPFLKASGLDVLPTGYILVDGGKPSAVSYMSNTSPVPAGKDDIASCTALAGEMLGMKLIYLDSGSGALIPVSASMIQKVRETVTLPLIVGGGIKTCSHAKSAWLAGANVIVVGNAIEETPALILSLAGCRS